jgi:anti-sigma regulatory factor (Ser/Thr protein kinase)
VQGAHSNSLTLAALPSAVKLGRTLAAVTLKYWGLDALVSPAEIVASELVTNAVKATGITDTSLPSSVSAHLATIHVCVVHRQSHITIEVWDSDPKPPAPAEADVDAEGGRGLMIVSAFCTRWDYYPLGGGKVVWGELEIPALPVTDAGLPRRQPLKRELEYRPHFRSDPELLSRVLRGLRQLPP